MARLLLICGLALWLGNRQATAQSPGTRPSSDVIRRADEQLDIKGIIFDNNAGNPVLRPAMTLEEFERDSAVQESGGRYGFESLEITGKVIAERLQMDVTLELSIETTGNLTIPLGMSNFHRLAAPQAKGVDEFNVTSADDDSGYQLNVSCSQPSKMTLQMQMSSKVQTGTASMVDFRLPDVSSRVELVVDNRQAVAEVIGRSDETVRWFPGDQRSSRILVESSGGNFSIRWRKPRAQTAKSNNLEVESEMLVRWDSPNDRPSAQIRMAVRNAKGPVDSIEVLLPDGADLDVESPAMGLGGRAVEFKRLPTDGDAAGTRWQVMIPPEEQQQRVDLNFEYQFADRPTSAQSPLDLRVPSVAGSVRHKGRIKIQVGDEYRLRWRTSPWIRGEASEVVNEPSALRQYPFRFDRELFGLPVWLSTNKRQLRVTSQSEVIIGDSEAVVDMRVSVVGANIDGQLKMEDAGWQIQSVQQVETDAELAHYLSESLEERVIELNSLGDSGSNIRIRGRLPLEQGLEKVKFPVPRVLGSGQDVVIRDATLTLIASGGTLLVVDLDASTGLTRMSSDGDADSTQTLASRFRFVGPEVRPIISGTLVDQPPRITLSMGTKIEADRGEVSTTIDWEVTSPNDLGGRLPVLIPEFDADSPDRIPFATTPEPRPREPWSVTVDGVPAILQWRDGGLVDLISDRLGRGKSIIQWRHRQSLVQDADSGSSMIDVGLPRPAIADVTMVGKVDIVLTSDQTRQWIPVDYRLAAINDPSSTSLRVDTIPREPLRLRLQPKVNSRNEQTVERTVLRTAISRETIFEQLLMSIRGGDSLQVRLPSVDQGDDAGLTVKAFLDGESVGVLGRNNQLVVALPGDNEVHHLDLRVWVKREDSSSIRSIEPLMKPPFGIGRIYWQVVAPHNSHVMWASPSIGRAMSWRFSLWNVYRQPTLSDQMLTSSPNATPAVTLQGNRYLYVGSDLATFSVIVFSRTVLWIMVGATVLAFGAMLSYFPASRHPLMAVVAAVAFSGLLVTAPDAAVLVGQVGMICLVLLITMFAIHSLIQPRSPGRILDSKSPSRVVPGSGVGRQVEPLPAPAAMGGVEIPETRSLSSSSPGERHPRETDSAALPTGTDSAALPTRADSAVLPTRADSARAGGSQGSASASDASGSEAGP